jgi:TolB-like protein/Tfp pilus assembly protein PilF
MRLWGAGVALLIGGAITGWLAQRQPSSAAHLAVMPLRVLEESQDDVAYLGVGIADAITTRLANTRQIALRPTSAVLPFQDAQSDVARVAASLNVQHLLIGSIQAAEDRLRISLQLVRADGVAIWGRSFDQPRTGLLELQDHIAEQVAVALRIELSPPERARLHVRYTDNPAAYDLYLRGRSLLVNYTEVTMRDAIRHFEQALAMDPDYALAHAGIATASAWFSVRYAHDVEALDWGKRAEQAAHEALKNDASLADAHLAIASAAGTTYGGFNWNLVLEKTSTALALDSSLDLAHLARMRVYYHLGLFDDARREGRLAQAVNPSASVELSRLEIVLRLFDGDFAAALDDATALLSRSDAPAVRHYLGLARYYAGDTAGARDVLGTISRRGLPDTRSQAALASIEAAAGMLDQARTRIRLVASAPDMDHHVAYSLGAAFAQLSEFEASTKWLTQAADSGFPCYPWFARDPLLDPVRRQPAFVELLARLRLSHEEARLRAHSNSKFQ